MSNILKWLRENFPVGCACCHRLIRYKDARLRRMTTGYMATLCADCDELLYHPWGDE